MDQKAFEAAVRRYWRVRAGQASKQRASGRVDAGLRGAVTGGAHMDAMAELMESIFVDAGFAASSIHHGSAVQLPGYFRPEKKWDLVVIHDDALAAAIEFKSHVGPSFGNNYNNRNEEAIGNAVDIWTAYREGRFGEVRPWLGYLLLLEEAPEVGLAGQRQRAVLRGRSRVQRSLVQEAVRNPLPPTRPRATVRRHLLRDGLGGAALSDTRAGSRHELQIIRRRDQSACEGVA